MHSFLVDGQGLGVAKVGITGVTPVASFLLVHIHDVILHIPLATKAFAAMITFVVSPSMSTSHVITQSPLVAKGGFTIRALMGPLTLAVQTNNVCIKVTFCWQPLVTNMAQVFPHRQVPHSYVNSHVILRV